VWEALAGRAPGQPVGPADPGLWTAVAERLNPAKAKPRLRDSIEVAQLITVRGVPYVMLRSPDGKQACYLRLTPEELQLAQLMDGTRTVARLVAEFARISGRLAPDQVTRVVADLAGNRMLDELPVDAFRRLDRVHRRPWPIRLGRGLLAAAKGQRVVLASIDPLVGFLYRAGGRLFFTRPVAVLSALIAVAGLAVFGWVWARGQQSVFLTGDSYAYGALVLLGLNVLALACHEFGHALAAKHAGRRVPVAGFLVYFGIPSVFVDTTDVWMAGRRARLLTTAAGPATGLVLAGAAQLVGLAYPPLAPWAFKLSFAWYVNALFNLNPFMALDGYYLVMDALEVPNLRARGLAWVAARLRRRPPRFGELDREGRLVALYGMLAVVWLVIAANLAYRIYTDRVAGLVIGLWRAGWPARVLLVAVVAGLAAPLVYVLFSWLVRRGHRLRERVSERRVEADTPRRLQALQSSALSGLPAAALTQLAGQARWVHPRTGEQLVFAGAAQSDVYVVVNGALEARRPGDPTGSVRQRVGAGGVVGLANALTGAPAALAWHTAGTTLLAVPSSAVAGAVGPLHGPAPAERADLEALLSEAPAFVALSQEDRLGLVSRARPLALPPGAPLILPGPSDAVVVSSGVVALPNGIELRRGTLIGPVGEELPGAVAVARTPTRTWTLPAVAGLPLLIGARPSASSFGPGRAPSFGAHPPGGYPPLAAPPGPPPSTGDDDVDRRFERRLWWLLILLLLFALLLTGSNLIPGPAWAEMPSDRALLAVTGGSVSATVNGSTMDLHKGDKVYVKESDQITVADRSTAHLTFRGGSLGVLCAGTNLRVRELVSDNGRTVQPTGKLDFMTGRLLVDTHSASKAFRPLALSVFSPAGATVNNGAARLAVDPGDTDLSTGDATFNGIALASTGDELTCGDGVALPKVGGSPSPSATPEESPSPSDSPSASPSPTPGPSTQTTTAPGTTPTRTTKPPTTGPPTTKPPTTGPPPTTSPPNLPPKITWVTDPGALKPPAQISQDVDGQPCNRGGSLRVFPVVDVTDDHDPSRTLRVEVRWTGFSAGARPMTWDGHFFGSVGPVPYPGKPNAGGQLSILVVAWDSSGAMSTLKGTPVTVLKC
jgi:putative peptide zinc metalloprotease protein